MSEREAFLIDQYNACKCHVDALARWAAREPLRYSVASQLRAAEHSLTMVLDELDWFYQKEIESGRSQVHEP